MHVKNFKYKGHPISSTFTNWKDFDDPTGGSPLNSLMQAKDGKLYGTTVYGGSNNRGVIFSFDPFTSIYAKLWDFDNESFGFDDDEMSLMQASDGKLYGLIGGENGNRLIFSFDPTTSVYMKLKVFYQDDGVFGGLTQASDGKLYGMTRGIPGSVGGGIFSFTPSSSTYTKLTDFSNTGGYSPTGRLMRVRDGKLYGTTQLGGSKNRGVIFSFDPSSSAYTKLKDFGGTDGSYPYLSLIQASNGNLYGKTSGGGISNNGVIFSFDPLASTYSIIRDLGSNTTGYYVSAGLTQANDAMLYGMTVGGGSSNYGVIFSVDPMTSAFTKLKDFNGANGASPWGSLLQVSDGKLYGITERGGSSDKGVIFSFVPSSSIYTKLKDFGDTDGVNPYGSLIQAGDGKLYGMTNKGGSNGYGTIFSFDITSSTYLKLKDFDETAGASPFGSLIQASDGKLYGMTNKGGSNGYGTIFSFDITSSTYSKLKDFDGTAGASPFGSLFQANDGKLYGMTHGGGSFNCGVIFSFDPKTATYLKLRDFGSYEGNTPYGSLIQAKDGKLYGKTSENKYHLGFIFSYNPSTSIYTPLVSLGSFFQSNPRPGIGSVLVEIRESYLRLTTPANNTTYLSGANVYLNAIASDSGGTISKVDFFSGSRLLSTSTVAPYSFKWKNVRKGEYVLTAKATDNNGFIITSAPVNISVVPNKPPTVSIITPANNQTFAESATIHFEAVAQDIDGRMGTVEFYNGSTLLAIERKIPYTYDWVNVPAGTYTLTARAKDNWGDVSISAPVTVTVIPDASLVSSRSSALKSKTNKAEIFSLALAPNPAKHMVNIYTAGLQKSKQATLSVISASGVIMKTMRVAGSAQTIPLNISSLVSGMYTIKLMSGDKVIYRKFVKL